MDFGVYSQGQVLNALKPKRNVTFVCAHCNKKVTGTSVFGICKVCWKKHQDKYPKN